MLTYLACRSTAVEDVTMSSLLCSLLTTRAVVVCKVYTHRRLRLRLAVSGRISIRATCVVQQLISRSFLVVTGEGGVRCWLGYCRLLGRGESATQGPGGLGWGAVVWGCLLTYKVGMTGTKTILPGTV